jgi:hypothetical protein
MSTKISEKQTVYNSLIALIEAQKQANQTFIAERNQALTKHDQQKQAAVTTFCHARHNLLWLTLIKPKPTPTHEKLNTPKRRTPNVSPHICCAY